MFKTSKQNYICVSLCSNRHTRRVKSKSHVQLNTQLIDSYFFLPILLSLVCTHSLIKKEEKKRNKKTKENKFVLRSFTWNMFTKIAHTFPIRTQCNNLNMFHNLPVTQNLQFKWYFKCRRKNKLNVHKVWIEMENSTQIVHDANA